MRIAYDLQACMTDSRDRGIGRYSENLVGAMVRMAGSRGSESQIALDGTDPTRLQDARSRLRHQRIAAPTVVYNYPSSAVTDLEPVRTLSAATLRGRFFEALSPDAVVQTTHFEAGTNYATDLHWSRPSAIPSAVVAYDLIPLVFPDRYMPAGSFVSQWYPRKCESFRKFDLFLAISQATRDDLIRYLDIPAERIHVIGAGLDESLLAAATTGARFHDGILGQLGILEPYVLMVGNGELYDHRVDGRTLTFGTDAYAEAVTTWLTETTAALGEVATKVAVTNLPCYSKPDTGLDPTPAIINDTTRQDWLNEVIARFVAAHPEVHLIDLRSFVCPTGAPRPTLNGVVLYKDGVHWSTQGAATVWSWLAGQVRAVRDAG